MIDYLPAMEDYIKKHSSEENPLLNKIYRETHIRYLNPRMVCGHIQGLFLTFLSRMIRPLKILEIGTFTGYSTICLAQGLPSNGTLYTIEIDDEMAEVANKYFDESGIKQINLIIGNAIEIIPSLNEQFDLIYIDGEKKEYPQYLSVCLPVLKKDGFLIADNVLWDGKVLDKEITTDKATLALRIFNNLIKENTSIEKVFLPIRDGLLICRKIH